MTKQQLKVFLEESKKFIEESKNYAMAYGFLEVAVDLFLKSEGGVKSGD